MQEFALEAFPCVRTTGVIPVKGAQNDKAVVLRQMERFVAPISKDDPEAHPMVAFEIEFRRTLGRIRWYVEQLKALDVKDLTWGKTKAEQVNATEFSGKNTTYEAKAALIHELQFRERQHLIAMERIWLCLTPRRIASYVGPVSMLCQASSARSQNSAPRVRLPPSAAWVYACLCAL